MTRMRRPSIPFFLLPAMVLSCQKPPEAPPPSPAQPVQAQAPALRAPEPPRKSGGEQLAQAKERSRKALAAAPAQPTAPTAASAKVKLAPPAAPPRPGYAVIRTSLGDIVMRLLWDQAPKTTENFVGLAAGTKLWTDPATGKQMKKPLYEGLFFHRVIPNFMIQTGDPSGTGAGKVGFTVPSEAKPDMLFDRPGLVALATAADPNSGSSQFFITVASGPWMNGKYAIFGEVVEGMEVAQAVAHAPRQRAGVQSDRPIAPVTLDSVSLEKSWPRP